MGAYAGVAVLAGLLFYFFNPAGAGDCSFNISAITMTLVLALVVSAVSMLPYVRAQARACRKEICSDAVHCVMHSCELVPISLHLLAKLFLTWHNS